MQFSKRILLRLSVSLIIIINLSWQDSNPIISTASAPGKNPGHH